MNNIHLATISILVKDRKSHADDVNRVLSENGDIILARLGFNAQNLNIKHCTGLITIVVKASKKEIKNLTKTIDVLYGIVAKVNILTD